LNAWREESIPSTASHPPESLDGEASCSRHRRGGTKENKFHINIKNSRFKEDPSPVDPYCSCSTCAAYSRAYLRHLYVSRELSYFRLATLHNLHFMLRFMEDIRESIRTGTFAELKERWLRKI